MSRAWDGEADETQLARLEAHLKVCPECAAAAARMREFLRRLDAAGGEAFGSPPET